VSLLGRVLVEKRRVLWPVAVGVLANVIVYVAVVAPLKDRVASGQARAATAERTQRDAERDLGGARATAQAKQRAEGDLQTFYRQVLPRDSAVARQQVYVRLAQLARESNLKLQRQTSDEERDSKDSRLRRVRLSVVLEGGYQDVRRFIHAIEIAPEFLIVDNTALALRNEPNAPLVLTLAVSTYFLSDANGTQ
jgi:Tfp pilus assembly protein PilO